GPNGWLTFASLGTAAAIAQLFVVRTPRNQSYHTTIVFLIPAVMLLPPELVAAIGLVQHVPEWLKNRNAWYSQTFNICNWTLSLLATWSVFQVRRATHHMEDRPRREERERPVADVECLAVPRVSVLQPFRDVLDEPDGGHPLGRERV